MWLYGLGAIQALSLYRWYSKHMTRSQAEELLKQEVSVWPQVNDILLAQNVRILNWGLAAARQARQCQDHHFYQFPIILFSIKSNEATGESWNLALKAGIGLFSPRFGQMRCRCEHHFLLRVSLFFCCFRGRKEVSLSETLAKLENILCLYLLNLQGECYSSKALGTKDSG